MTTYPEHGAVAGNRQQQTTRFCARPLAAQHVRALNAGAMSCSPLSRQLTQWWYSPKPHQAKAQVSLQPEQLLLQACEGRTKHCSRAKCAQQGIAQQEDDQLGGY